MKDLLAAGWPTAATFWLASIVNRSDTPRLATLTFPFTLDQFMPWCNFVLWSLGIEFWFSMVFPLLLLLSRRVSIWALCAMALMAETLSANHWGSFPSPRVGLAFYFVFLILISALSYRFIEFGTEKDWKKLFRPT